MNYAFEILKSNKLLNQLYNGDFLELLPSFLKMWQEPHRHYHSINHLNKILENIQRFQKLNPYKYKDVLEAVALFHDIVYNPLSKTNKEDSATFFFNSLDKQAKDKYLNEIELIHNIILSTTYNSPLDQNNENFGQYLNFWYLDLYDLIENNVGTIINNEKLIFREFQHYSPKIYFENKKKFIESIGKTTGMLKEGLNTLNSFISSWKPNIGIYCGSFNPFHVGHGNVLEKAEKIFDKVVIAQGDNPNKNSMDLIELQLTLPFHEVYRYHGLTTNFLNNYQRENNCNVTLIRGLRNGYDLQYELNYLSTMKDICPNINCVHILSDNQHYHISSSSIRELKRFNSVPESYYYNKYR